MKPGILALIVAVVAAAAVFFFVYDTTTEGPAEQAGAAVDEAVNDAANAVEEATD